jgi:hypothetical protein
MTTLQDESTQVSAERPLDATDRCDSCGAQAFVRAVVSGSELLFCAHHARKHEDKLKSIASSWHDETHKLYAHS